MKKTISALLALAAVLSVLWALHYLQGGMDAAEVVRKLSGMRISVELYRQEHRKLPASFADTLREGTLEEAPELKLPGHFKTSRVRDTPSMLITNTGGWAYVNDPADPAFGLVYIDSARRDERSRFWSEF
jgi:hypothetical protein